MGEIFLPLTFAFPGIMSERDRTLKEIDEIDDGHNLKT